LILAGSIADAVGSRTIFLIGCFHQGKFVLACGFAKTGIDLTIFRAMQGIALSYWLPIAVSIINNSVPNGRRRTLGLAFWGACQAFGFCIGLVLGRLFTIPLIGHLINMCTWLQMPHFFSISFWGIPKDPQTAQPSWLRLPTEIDWIGAALASTCLGMLSYVLA